MGASGKYRPKFKAADFPRPDLSTPTGLRTAARHITNVYEASSPAAHQAGKLWYPKVHDAVRKGVRGTHLTPMQGAGLVAAVSPNMDFERNNIGAFAEMHALKGHQWDAIKRSAERNPGPGHQRTPEATDALKGLSISTAADAALLKAHRIYVGGEHPDDVLNRRTSPKTNAFAHAIHEPEGKSGMVTIDGRAHDIANNEMWPWTYSGRGIDSAALPSGKPTRYEHFENAYRTAAGAVDEHPNAMQAITWMGGKEIETSAPTKSGKPRVKGVARKRTPYV
jgi:hypothetical protein